MHPEVAESRLNALLRQAGLSPLDSRRESSFLHYLTLFLRWNRSLNLSALRVEEEIISRHFIESIVVSKALPQGIRSVLDFGSGAGLPGIPLAICRPEITVTLAESQGKKAAFLQEAVRVLGLSAKVHAGRAEALREHFDCVTMRAVDKMPKAVSVAVDLVAPTGWLALMTTEDEIAGLQEAAGGDFSWGEPTTLPFGERRILALGQRVNFESLISTGCA